MTVNERVAEFRRRMTQVMLDLDIGHATIALGLESGDGLHYAQATMFVHNGLTVKTDELMGRHGEGIVSLVNGLRSMRASLCDCGDASHLVDGVNHPPARA